MKIHKSHLLRFISENPSLEDLSGALFRLGHEHEIENDIFEFEITPNRGDCLSVQGVARDLNAIYKTDLDLDIYKGDIQSFDFNFRNNAQLQCPKISFLMLEIDNLPDEYNGVLKEYFQLLGLNKNNFFTDVSNYVAYELGQPSHCYEFESVCNNLELCILENHSDFRSLFGTDHKISEGDLVFTSDNRIVNLAGIMGSIDSACNKKTMKVITEFAFFNPQSIAGRAVKYNLISDASHKFERGVDPNLHDKAMRRFLKIVSEHCNITELKIYNQSTINHQREKIRLSSEKINSVLGTNLEENKIQEILRSLGFEVKDFVKTPSYRNDINNINDLAEEVARVVGYDNLPKQAINVNSKKKSSKNNEALKRLKYFFIKNGFNEVINESFSSSNDQKGIKIDNPIDSNRISLRTSLKRSLVKNLGFNERRQKEIIKLFEVSDIYLEESEQNPSKRVGIIISGRRGKNPEDFLKKLDHKYLEEIFSEVGFQIAQYVEVIDRRDINSKTKTKVYYAEFLINKIEDNLNEFEFNLDKMTFQKFREISEFPSSNRDFSFLIDSMEKKNFIEQCLNAHSSINLREYFNFDIYKNPKTGEIKLGYRLIFQSFTQTLNDKNIDKEVESILKPILSDKAIKIPGLN